MTTNDTTTDTEVWSYDSEDEPSDADDGESSSDVSSVTLGTNGWVYSGSSDGTIRRYSPPQSVEEVRESYARGEISDTELDEEIEAALKYEQNLSTESEDSTTISRSSFWSRPYVSYLVCLVSWMIIYGSVLYIGIQHGPTDPTIRSAFGPLLVVLGGYTLYQSGRTIFGSVSASSSFVRIFTALQAIAFLVTPGALPLHFALMFLGYVAWATIDE